MVACGFSTLVPALIFQLQIFRRHAIGAVDVGDTLYNGESHGTLTSSPGYGIHLNATTIHMDDFFFAYGDGSNYGISPRGLVVTDDNVPIGVHASGVFANTTHIAQLLAGTPGVGAQSWGESYSASTWTFDVSKTSAKYRRLGDSVFVGNFRLMPGNPDNTSFFNVEYRLSEITPGPLIKGDCPY